MNLFDRFILTIYSFALIVVSSLGIGVGLRLIPQTQMQAIIAGMYAGTISNIPYLVVLVIFLLISVRFFLTAFTRKKERKEKGIRQRSDYGEIHITLQTIQSIAERAARKVKGVRELKTTVKALDSGNLIHLRLTFDGETPLPELTERLQQEVKAQVEAITGVEITEVSVVITEVAPPDHPPLRTRRVE